MLKQFTLGAIVLVALLHLGFMVLEATRWSSRLGRRLTHLKEETAQETVGIGVNMGLYNGFLGLALLWATFALGARSAYSVQWILLGFIVIAGLVGAVTIRNPGIFVFQSLPAILALVLITIDRPYPRTEEEATRNIIQIEQQILTLKSKDPEAKPRGEAGAVPRGQHPKLHGLVRARFTVTDDVPAKMRLGIFREPGKTYEALLRFSNARNADDRDRGGHGMAIKLLNVSDEKVGAEKGIAAQDFVLFDSPVFFVGNPIQYVEFEEATLRSYGKSKLGTLGTTFLNYYWRHPHQFLNLLKTQRSDVTDPLAIRYWSVTPYKLGETAVKYSTRLSGDGGAFAAELSENRLREAMKNRLDHHDAEFLFQVQAQSDSASMPVEDPTIGWDESVSRPMTVARIFIPQQEFDTVERRQFAEGLSFTPWHALPEHAPLGGINRVRRAVYESLSEFRHALNRASQTEPIRPPSVD
jgi:uncharacterized membrane protein